MVRKMVARGKRSARHPWISLFFVLARGLDARARDPTGSNATMTEDSNMQRETDDGPRDQHRIEFHRWINRILLPAGYSR